MKMYKISSYGDSIEEVEITRKSDSSVWFIYRNSERRESNNYYFDTWDEAKDAIITRERKEVERYERQLSYCKEKLVQALNLTR